MQAGVLNFGVVILAAGASSRMGVPKMLLPWGNTSVVGSSVERWDRLGAKDIAVVCASKDHKLKSELLRLGCTEPAALTELAREANLRRSSGTADMSTRRAIILNSEPELGMFSSVRLAALWTGWSAESTHVIIALGDQPHLRKETLLRLIFAGVERPERVWQPRWNGRPKHPVLMPASAFFGLSRTRGETLREYLQTLSPPPLYMDSDDPGLDLDLDYPADYVRALGLASPCQPI